MRRYANWQASDGTRKAVSQLEKENTEGDSDEMTSTPLSLMHVNHYDSPVMSVMDKKGGECDRWACFGNLVMQLESDCVCGGAHVQCL